MAVLGYPGPRPSVEAPDPAAAAEGGAPSRRRFSTLSLRILAPNVLALGILVGGVLYLDQYRDGLIDAKIAALQTQGEIIAGALGESALAGPPEAVRLDVEVAQRLIRRLTVPTRTRARLFDVGGDLVADSRELVAAGRHVQLKYLPPPGQGDAVIDVLSGVYDWILPRLPSGDRFPRRDPRPIQSAGDLPEALGALGGEFGGAVRSDHDGSLIITVAVPVQQLRQVLGALVLSTDSADIEESVRSVRVAIIQVFVLALAVTVLLSIFLAGTIARPVRRLAQAADQVRRWRGQRVQIPDFRDRGDEIGDLSGALGDMTNAFYLRLDAIGAFAADVAHEIKNPLTSLRSAVESLALAKDESQRGRLLTVIEEDVGRLDRLISDISNASRVDAELARATAEPVDLTRLLETVIHVHQDRGGGKPRFELQTPADPLVVEGVPGRLGQVVDNLVSNAVSFSPDDGVIRLGLSRGGSEAVLTVEDDGPGLPDDMAERIFERFYSHRPAGEAFGQHSGLGLSIARQIVEAHGGRIHAENRRDADGQVKGARFIVRLPL